MPPVVVCRSPQAPSRPIQARPDPFAGAHTKVLVALGSEPPLPLPIWPLARDLDDRHEYLRELLGAMGAYLRALLEDVAQNVPRDLDLRQIEALWCDLTSEVAGTGNSAAAALPGRRS